MSIPRHYENQEVVYDYEVLPVIPLEDAPIHTSEHPFCDDPSCGCHEDPTLIEEVAHAVAAGALTADEATDLIAGKGGSSC